MKNVEEPDSSVPFHQFKRALELVVSPVDPREFFVDFEKIGEGSTGAVFTATDLRTNMKVALKQMNLHKQQRKELLFNEVVIMREHQHENIVRLLESFLVEDELWVSMEYVDSGSLTDIVTHTR